MSTPKFSLKAYERLKSKKQIGYLFANGKSHFTHPFKVFYLLEQNNTPELWPVKFTVSIPKKKIKLAVKRNLLKRRTREAYRLNKLGLDEKINKSNYKISLMFVYLEKEVKNYDVLEKSILKHINEIIKRIDRLA